MSKLHATSYDYKQTVKQLKTFADDVDTHPSSKVQAIAKASTFALSNVTTGMRTYIQRFEKRQHNPDGIKVKIILNDGTIITEPVRIIQGKVNTE